MLLTLVLPDSMEITCPADGTLTSIDGYTIPYREQILCHLNRLSIYVLQGLFNVVLFSMAKVSWVVSGAARKKSKTYLMLNKILLSYCVFTPLLCMLIATVLTYAKYFDLSPESLSEFNYHHSRWIFLCGPRIGPVAETVLMYAPFVVTGFFSTMLSVHVAKEIAAARNLRHNITGSSDKATTGFFRSLYVATMGGTPKGNGSDSVKVHHDAGSPQLQKSSSKNEGSMQDSGPKRGRTQESENDIALRLLAIRLSWLGILCSFFLVIFVLSTLVAMPKIAAFGDKYNEAYVCKTVLAGCTGECSALDAAADATKPSSNLIGTQYACLAFVPALFGVFFMSQAVSRLFKEYRTKTGVFRRASVGVASESGEGGAGGVRSDASGSAVSRTGTGTFEMSTADVLSVAQPSLADP